MLQKSNLHNYQTKIVDHILNNKGAGVFAEMGLGKTVSTLTGICELLEDLDIIKPLIIAPLMVTKSVWHNEAKEWEHLKHLTFSIITGTVKERLAALEVEADIYVMNRENVVWLSELYKSKFPFDFIGIDESSSFKNGTSKRFRALRKLIKLPIVRRTAILTGTPAPNGYIDLWSQIFILDKGERLGKNITMYRRSFFDPDFMGYGFTIKPGADQDINKRINDVVISLKAKDYLELPDFIPTVIDIPLPKKLQKQYTEFEKDLILQLDNEDDEITALTEAALSNKLLQFSSGAIYDDEKNVTHLHDLKYQALDEIIEMNPNDNILLAYHFKHQKEELRKRYKDLEFMDKDMKNVKRWNDGKIKILALHPASAGHGLNIQKGGSLIVWMGFQWSLELYQQFNARLFRQGQKDHVRCLHLAVGRIEYRLLRSLAAKDVTQNEIYAALKG